MSNKSVLVTRPLAQGKALCGAIEQAGGSVVHFPGIEIHPAENKTVVLSRLAEIGNCDWVIFISTNAVEYTDYWLEGDLRHHLNTTKVAAVGKATKKALEQQGIKVDLSPQEQFNSESLLARPELKDVSGKQILIVRGNGGRQLLGDILRDREAKVFFAEVYQRLRPTTNIQPLIRLWKTEGIDAVTVTSCEILDNIIDMLDSIGVKLLRETPLVVVSDRIKERARKYGIKQIKVANTVSDMAIINAVSELLPMN